MKHLGRQVPSWDKGAQQSALSQCQSRTRAGRWHRSSGWHLRQKTTEGLRSPFNAGIQQRLTQVPGRRKPERQLGQASAAMTGYERVAVPSLVFPRSRSPSAERSAQRAGIAMESACANAVRTALSIAIPCRAPRPVSSVLSGRRPRQSKPSHQTRVVDLRPPGRAAS